MDTGPCNPVQLETSLDPPEIEQIRLNNTIPPEWENTLQWKGMLTNEAANTSFPGNCSRPIRRACEIFDKIANAIRLYGYDDVTTHCDEIETTITSIINLILVSALIRNRRPRGARIDQNQLREGSSGLRDAKIYSRIMAVN